MRGKVVTAKGRSRKSLVTSVTMGAVLVTSRLGAPAKVYATSNEYDWTKQTDQNLLGGSYTSAASSADGSQLILSSSDGGEGYNAASPLYISSNYGATWTNITETIDSRIRDLWKAVDISDDGQTMIAASDMGGNLNTFTNTDGKIFISHDAGSTWENVSPDGATHWTYAALSGDGNEIVALATDDTAHVYVSTNGGDTWHVRNISNVEHWHSLSVSGDGQKILVGGETSGEDPLVEISANAGSSWTNITPDHGDLSFSTKTAMSEDGSKIAVSVFGYTTGSYDKVYKSSNDGSSWTTIDPTDSDVNEWIAVAMSGDGSQLSVLDNNDKMYISHDDGANWSLESPGQEHSDSNNWRSMDYNQNGSRIVMASLTNAYVGYNSAIDVNTVTFSNSEDSKTIRLVTPSGTTITCHSGVKESSLSAKDGAYSYPLGLVDFCFSGADESNGITLTFVTNLKPSQVKLRKYNPTTKEYATITNAHITETTYGGKHALRVTYNVTDNGPLDTNSASGEVSDPVGLAVSVGAPNTGFERTTNNIKSKLLINSGLTFGIASLLLKSRKRTLQRNK